MPSRIFKHFMGKEKCKLSVEKCVILMKYFFLLLGYTVSSLFLFDIFSNLLVGLPIYVAPQARTSQSIFLCVKGPGNSNGKTRESNDGIFSRASTYDYQYVTVNAFSVSE